MSAFLLLIPLVVTSTNKMVKRLRRLQRNALEARVLFRVKPEDEPLMASKIRLVGRLIQKVRPPLIDSIFRNQASESSALAYLQNRHEEQGRAEARGRAHLFK